MNLHHTDTFHRLCAATAGIVHLHKGVAAGIAIDHNLVGRRGVVTQHGIQHHRTILSVPAGRGQGPSGVHGQRGRGRKINGPGKVNFIDQRVRSHIPAAGGVNADVRRVNPAGQGGTVTQG